MNTPLTRADVLATLDPEVQAYVRKIAMPEEERCWHCLGLGISPPETCYIRYLREQRQHPGLHKRRIRGNPVCCHCGGSGKGGS